MAKIKHLTSFQLIKMILTIILSTLKFVLLGELKILFAQQIVVRFLGSWLIIIYYCILLKFIIIFIMVALNILKE